MLQDGKTTREQIKFNEANDKHEIYVFKDS